MLWLNLVSIAGVHAATMAEISSNLVKHNAQQKGDFLVEGAPVVTPKLGPKLNDDLKVFRQIKGI